MIQRLDSAKFTRFHQDCILQLHAALCSSHFHIFTWQRSAFLSAILGEIPVWEGSDRHQHTDGPWCGDGGDGGPTAMDGAFHSVPRSWKAKWPSMPSRKYLIIEEIIDSIIYLNDVKSFKHILNVNPYRCEIWWWFILFYSGMSTESLQSSEHSVLLAPLAICVSSWKIILPSPARPHNRKKTLQKTKNNNN